MPSTSKEIKEDFPFNASKLDPSLLSTSTTVSGVELDALVVLKLIKHARDAFPLPATGQLLGIDIKGTLGITNSFPFSSPEQQSQASDAPADSGANLDGQEYQLQMLRCLRTLNFDANTAGWYQSTYMGSFWNQAFIETQFSYQKAFGNSVVILYDPAKTAAGNLSIRALRLSDVFMQVYESGEFSMEKLSSSKLTPSLVFETVPLTIRNSHLLAAMAVELNESSILSSAVSLESTLETSTPSHIEREGPLRPNFDALNVSSETYLSTHLEYLAETVEEAGNEQWRWQGWQRSYQREQQRYQQSLTRMRLENEAAIAAGKPPVYSADQLAEKPASLAKVLANEPSRLESLIISNQIETYCKQVNQFAGPALSKLFVARSLHSE